MSRRDDEPYNPYPEGPYGNREGDDQNPHHHHHRHHGLHHESNEEPRYGGLEHRPPPPSRPEYGGYGDGPYGHRPGDREDDHRRYGNEDRRNPYPPGPYGNPEAPYGNPSGPYPPAPPAGQGYGDSVYQNSPYASGPTPHRRSAAEEQPPRARQIPGLPVRLHCKADPNFSLAVVPGQGPVMKPTDPRDDYQVWYKDERLGTRVKDETGATSFSLINKVTGEALRHAPEDLKQCLLAHYNENAMDETLWWSMSEDMGLGYRCVRMATKITRNLDVLRGDKKSGGVKDGSPVITFAWKKQDNQIWKMIPA